MVTNLKSLLITVLFLNLVMPVFSFQPSGGVLSLDGVDDYAVYPFAERGFLFPKNTDKFTVEMWFYPKAGPKNGERNLILSQQIYFELTSLLTGRCKDHVDKLCGFGGAHLNGPKDTRGALTSTAPVEINRWNYVAIIYEKSTFAYACNDRIQSRGRIALMDRISVEILGKPKDFFVGGYAEELVLAPGPITRFQGEIDAIRFSKIARYDLPEVAGVEEPFEPPHRFSVDQHTIALWNFDEPAGATRFQDETNDKKILIGMNGASIGSPLAVNPDSTSLTTTWGQIKSRSR